MKILGDIRPFTNLSYTYTMVTNAGAPVKVNQWRVYQGNRLLAENGKGVFKFGTNTAGSSLKLVARVRDSKTDNLVDFSIMLQPLAGQPSIQDLFWRDVNGIKIHNSLVAYLDKVTLVIKTQNIPQGDTLKITIYEDEYADGHGDSSRNMGTYMSTPVNKNGNAYLELNSMQLYQKTLNDLDYKDESVHEFYAQVRYYNKMDVVKDGIQLKVKNELKQLVKPNTGNKPVVVGEIDRIKKNDKGKVNVTFNMFFDGTMNNMTNTKARVEPDKDLIGVYDKKSNKKDDSYMNFYSNVALLYMNNIVEETDNIISIYTEGIGTADKKSDQVFPGGAMGESILIYLRGIKDKVQRGIVQMKEKAKEKYFDKNIKIGKVTINVFGFSRGAAAARYFMSQETLIQIRLKLKSSKDVTFNFIGLYDTVASFGVMHINDVYELNLDIGGKAKKVIHLTALDEYRENFKLTNINSSIKAGVGYELAIPGVHSDIGGGYGEKENEIRILKEDSVFENYSLNNKKEIEAQHLLLRKKYVDQGWYKASQLFSQKVSIQDAGNGKSFYKLQLIGKRIKVDNFTDHRIPNNYQYIALAIMKTFCEKYTKMPFWEDKIKKDYSVKGELEPVKNQLYNYAISNDGINSLRVTLPHDQLMWVRNKYLHRSNKDDDWTMSGRYDDNGNPNRDILEG